MFFNVFAVLTDNFALTFGALVVIGGFAYRIQPIWLRAIILILLAILLPLLLVMEGMVSGCAFNTRGGEQCMWFGFGMVIAVIGLPPLSALALGIGALIGYFARRPRRD